MSSVPSCSSCTEWHSIGGMSAGLSRISVAAARRGAAAVHPQPARVAGAFSSMCLSAARTSLSRYRSARNSTNARTLLGGTPLRGNTAYTVVRGASNSVSTRCSRPSCRGSRISHVGSMASPAPASTASRRASWLLVRIRPRTFMVTARPRSLKFHSSALR